MVGEAVDEGRFGPQLTLNMWPRRGDDDDRENVPLVM